MLCHAVTFRFLDSVGDDEVAAFVARLEQVPDRIDTVRWYRFGADLGLTPGAGNFAIVAVFDDVAGWRAYRDHPLHREVVELAETMVEDRTQVQFEVPG